MNTIYSKPVHWVHWRLKSADTLSIEWICTGGQVHQVDGVKTITTEDTGTLVLLYGESHYFVFY